MNFLRARNLKARVKTTAKTDVKKNHTGNILRKVYFYFLKYYILYIANKAIQYILSYLFFNYKSQIK